MITETLPAGSWSTTVNGVADDLSTSVALDQDRTITFTNTLATVAGTQETKVLGTQEERQLPATGVGNLLALVGAVLVVVGGMMLVGSRRSSRTAG